MKDAEFSPEQIQGADKVAKVCDVKALKAARAQGVSAKELKEKDCALAALKAAGFSAAQLKRAGFSTKDLKDAGVSAAELKAAGFSPEELGNAGYSKGDLLRAGYTAEQAGYPPSPPAGAEVSQFHPAPAPTCR